MDNADVQKRDVNAWRGIDHHPQIMITLIMY